MQIPGEHAAQAASAISQLARPNYLEEKMTILQKHRLHLFLLLFLLIALGACSLIQPDTEPDSTPSPSATEVPETPGQATDEANVENIEILLLESFPVQVNVIVSGTLPDGCTSLNEPTPRREGNTFVINLTTVRLEEEACSQAEVPFDQVVSLPAEGLAAGTYTVAANGVTGTFTLEVDNVMQEEPTPTSGTETGTETAGDSGDISGRVWHDLCAVTGGEGGEEAVPSDGCVVLEEGGYQANGLREPDEPGIEGILVNLAEGSCPGSALESATTDAMGNYTFSGLEPGSYCVSVDALSEQNATILVPGDWTSPEPEGNTATAASTVNVTAGADSGEIDFGWDYQFLPEAGNGASAAKDCTDSASFLADVTVQDNEILPPTFVFTKTWQLENSGTCTWGEEYDLVFANGDPMGAPDTIPLAQEVPPTSTIQLSAPMVAPDLNGTYLSEWMLRNELGQTFGIPGPFWVQIVITSSIPEVGSYINGVLWADSCTVVDESVTEPPEGCVALEDGTIVADGVYDVGESRIEGVTVALAEGACPADTVLTTTRTGPDGRYAFTDLEAGTYCVFVDSQAAANQSVLVPGTWTWPEVTEEPVGITINLVEFEPVSDAYFGWDYEFE